PALAGAERRHLRALGLLRRRDRLRGRRCDGGVRARRRYARRERRALGHRIVVALRPVPPPAGQRGKPGLSQAPHQPAAGHVAHRPAPRARGRGRPLRALLGVAPAASGCLRAQGGVPPAHPSPPPARPADALRPPPPGVSRDRLRGASPSIPTTRTTVTAAAYSPSAHSRSSSAGSGPTWSASP